MTPEEIELLMSMNTGQQVGPVSMPGEQQAQPSVMASLAGQAQPYGLPQPPDLSLSEEYLNDQMSNPRQMLWAGMLQDLGNLFGGWNGSDYGGRQLQGTGFKMMQMAKQQNKEVLQRRLMAKQQKYRQDLEQWRLRQPNYQQLGSQLLAIDPVSGGVSVAHQGPGSAQKQQIFGNAQSGYYRLGEDGQAVPLVGGIAPPEVQANNFSNENALRDDYTRDAKTFNEQLDATQRARDAAKAYYASGSQSDKLAADKSLIYNFVKAHDPSSTVSASEAADVSNTPGIEAGIRNLYNKVFNGESLTDEQRRSLLRQIEQLALNAQGQVNGINTRYSELAGGWGVNPNAVVISRKHEMPEGYNAWLGQQTGATSGLQRRTMPAPTAQDLQRQQLRTEELPTVPLTGDSQIQIDFEMKY